MYPLKNQYEIICMALLIENQARIYICISILAVASKKTVYYINDKISLTYPNHSLKLLQILRDIYGRCFNNKFKNTTILIHICFNRIWFKQAFKQFHLILYSDTI